MDLHVRILAWFHLAFGLAGLIGVFFVFIVFGGAAGVASFVAAGKPGAWIAVPVLSIIGSMLLLLVLTLSIPGIIAGWGLLWHKPWARIVTIVLSVLHFINFPFGTLLSIYGLWVLLSKDTEQIFTRTIPDTT